MSVVSSGEVASSIGVGVSPNFMHGITGFDTLLSKIKSGDRVLVRVDYNTPMNGPDIGDDTRIKASLPTIQALLARGAVVILMSHFGRPSGKTYADRCRGDQGLSVVGARLEALLKTREVTVLDPIQDGDARDKVVHAKPGRIFLLENLRFHVGEEKNDPEFSKKFYTLADFFVQDAFGALHRKHASTDGIPRQFKGRSCAGKLVHRELLALDGILGDAGSLSPESRSKSLMVAVVGGAKVSTKIGVVSRLMAMPRVENVIIGGGMAFPFLKAQGCSIGRSLCDDRDTRLAEGALSHALSGKLVLPTDIVVVDHAHFQHRMAGGDAVATRVEQIDGIGSDDVGVDIGPKSVALFASVLGKAKTVVWNGPMGIFEKPEFSSGSRGVAHCLASLGRQGVVVFVGGGESVALVQQLGLSDAMGHVSTGGGATLECLEGNTLPGLEALKH